MSCGCGQSPVIISGGASAAPRMDVETVPLCDVLPDGTVAATVLVEPVYDTNTGARVGTRVVDPVTGDPYTPTGTLTACGGQEAGTAADVETWPLCVLNTNGSVLQYVRAEQVYDEQGAPSGPPRLVDAVTGLPVAIPGGATVGVCPDDQPCASLTTPAATVGLCLPDGTPLAVVVTRDCDGQVTQEGWVNLRTGAWSAGAPPAGTIACGDSQSIQVSGTFCDLDPDTGEVLGLVLIEYSYAADGTIAGVRLVDAVTGTTYTPQGEISVCPAGVDQPEQDIVQLCDVQADGTSVPMIRDYRRDEAGAVTGHTDYRLDGTPYTPTGTVGACEPEKCETVAVQTLRLCDLDPDVTPDSEGRRCAVPFLRHLTFGCDGALISSTDTEMDGTTPYTPVQAVDCGSGGVPAQVELAWPLTGIAEDPAGTSRQDFIYTVTNPETGDAAEVRLHASSLAGGSCGAYNPAAPVFNNPTTYTLTLDQAAQEMTVFRLDLVDFDTFEGITQLNPPPDRVEGNVTWDGGSTVTSNANNITAYLYWDNPPAQITYRYGNTGGGLACTSVAFQGMTLKAEGCCGCEPEQPEQPEPCTKQIVERYGCDDTDGDGVGDVRYTELWAVDPCGGEAPVLLGTYEDGDPTRPYTPTAPVECTTAETLPGPLSTGVRNVTGTAPQDLAGSFPGLQSVSLTVLAGTVNVTMSDGTAVPIPAGVSLTWSVVKEPDAALAAAAFAGADAAASYLLNWTWR